VSFREKYESPPPPDDDVLVWELHIPAEAEGAVVALCDGYEGKLQLRSKMDGRQGAFAAWAAPAYRREVEALLDELARRHGVRAEGPRAFAEADLAAGMHLTPRRRRSDEG
jgi:hypothetical protein